MTLTLCMMYPRLVLAKKFLSDDGIIFVSIDDTELPLLRILMDEIFRPAKNMLSCFVWQTEGNFDNQAKIKICHEYILAYTKNHSKFPPPPIIDPNIDENSKLFKNHIRNTVVKNGPKNPISEIVIPAGFPADFKEGIIPKRNHLWPQYKEDLIIKDYTLQNTVTAETGWSSKKILQSFIKNNYEPVLDTKKQETQFVITKTGNIDGVKKRPENQSHVISVLREVGTTQQASATLDTMGIKFDYPKPVGLIKYLLSMVQGNDYIVMDFFAGSGTTAQSVLELNNEDEGKRRFILVESEENICKNICMKRISKIISEPYVTNQNGKSETVEALSGGFKFCQLGSTLFNEFGHIREEVTFAELANYIFFIETGNPLISETNEPSPLLGIEKDVAVYLLYNGILGDKTPIGGNVLTRDVLASLPLYDGEKIIYGTSCRISTERLKKEKIIFKQIPYEVKVN